MRVKKQEQTLMALELVVEVTYHDDQPRGHGDERMRVRAEKRCGRVLEKLFDSSVLLDRARACLHMAQDDD